jgi:hypothetical protein
MAGRPAMIVTLTNVRDRRHGWIGEWDVEPLVYDELTEADVGRTVIYFGTFDYHEAGTLSSFRDGLIWARFSRGDTAAACRPDGLCFGVRPRDGDLGR